MAAIASIAVPTAPGHFAALRTTLSASDTITFTRSKKQLAVFHNPTGGSLTVTIDGDGGTTVLKEGLGSVNVSAGYQIAVAAGASQAVILAGIADYLQGVVTLSGAAGLVLQLFDL